MSKTTYHISLKGFVGGPDFNRATVDNVLAENEGKQVNVLIDSLGGSLATGLSISAAFKNHGNVNVHFVGLNASAATIASLGAAHISIDAGAMYLVHQCSMEFFEWGSLNSAQFATLIADCEKIKADLDKLDINCAQLYAARCKLKPEDLLALMKAGGWLTAKEALEWGFVDEITDLADEPAPKLTDTMATAMANAGIPIPAITLDNNENAGLFARFINALSSFFKITNNTINSAMNKTFTAVCSVLGVQALEMSGNTVYLSDEQLRTIDRHITELNNSVKQRDESIAAKDASIAELQAKLDKKPAADSNAIVDSHPAHSDNDAFGDFIATGVSANKLFNSIP